MAISLNGNDLGTVPPDTMDADTRERDVVLPAAALKVGDEQNTITFDNVLNPPQDDPWKWWNIWLEVTPVPDMSADEARRRAQQEIDRAAKLYEGRNVGAENLFRAWKTYRDVWLVLEATPNHDQALHQIARTKMSEIRPELDRKCNGLIVEYRKALNQRPQDLVKGRAILEDIPTSFPTREHPCFNFGRALLKELDDLGEPEEQ